MIETNEYAIRTCTEAKKRMVGRKIADVRYLTQEEADDLGWDARCPVIILDDGNYLYPSSDDEGNEAGAMFTSFKSIETMAVVRG
jgi:hypothetical protein